MEHDASAKARLIAELELALADPEQRRHLADFFAVLIEWSLERKSEEASAPNGRASATQSDQALLQRRSTRLARGVGQEESR